MVYKAVIIDDEPWTREVIRRLGQWRSLSIEIAAEASDGEAGLELVNRLRPDIIISDVRMPHMDGIELIASLRDQGSQVPVIFVSGYDDFSYVRGAIRLNAVDYLLKPIKPDELNDRLKQCVKILETDRNAAEERTLDMSGFLNAPWTAEYERLRDRIYESLFSNNTDLICQGFDELLSTIRREEGAQISGSVSICIYADLYNCLRTFLAKCGYTAQELLFKPEASTGIGADAGVHAGVNALVFSRDLSAGEVVDHCRALFCAAAGRVAELVKSRNRLDISRIRAYIDKNYAKGISLEETAARFYVSKEYLSKLFKAENGLGFQDYVRRLRMEKARELIILKGVPIKEVPDMTGFADTAHFYKAFKEYFGMTPGQMRRTANG